MRALISASLVGLLAGCGSLTPQGPMPALDPPPICYNERQCDAMWSEAIVQASNIGGMRIQTATDSYLQTYNATDYDRLGAKVRKMPRPDGGTAIESRFECYYPCGELAYRAVNLFTAKVKAAGAPFGATEASATPASTPAMAPSENQGATKDQRIQQLRQQNLPYDEYQKRYREIMAE